MTTERHTQEACNFAHRLSLYSAMLYLVQHVPTQTALQIMLRLLSNLETSDSTVDCEICPLLTVCDKAHRRSRHLVEKAMQLEHDNRLAQREHNAVLVDIIGGGNGG